MASSQLNWRYRRCDGVTFNIINQTKTVPPLPESRRDGRNEGRTCIQGIFEYTQFWCKHVFLYLVFFVYGPSRLYSYFHEIRIEIIRDFWTRFAAAALTATHFMKTNIVRIHTNIHIYKYTQIHKYIQIHTGKLNKHEIVAQLCPGHFQFYLV